MPTISEFYGILIQMYYDDHAPPHFHAKYGEHEALIRIAPLGLLKGNLPPKALGLVMEWALKNQDALIEEWKNVENHKRVHKIPPLD